MDTVTDGAATTGAPPAPVVAIAPSGLRAWHCFAFLIVTAVVMWFWIELIVEVLLSGRRRR